jgi:D-serine deaminase-like pyridoxal phosphate-dependent protein
MMFYKLAEPCKEVLRMNADYKLKDPAGIFSPALLFYKHLIQCNLERAIAIAGSPARLRPHAKTHKTREITRMELAAGITKHKCATLAEAEVLAGCGAPDVLVAYPLVGPNCARMARLARMYPDCRFAVLVDHPVAAQALSDAMAAAGQTVDVLLDLNVGQHRTGIAPGEDAVALYEFIARLQGLRPGGLQVYDGHNTQESLAERQQAVRNLLDPVLRMLDTLEKKGLPVPRLVVGGTPTFPVYAAMNLPGLECSPGTLVLHDHGYGTRYPDLAGFAPAALVLTRVVSRPTANRVTFDVGTKAIASDPPAGKRCAILGLSRYEAVAHNEEHLVVETPEADRFTPGDVAYAVPTHICPTCALHRQALVVEDGRVTETWDIAARDRLLSV